MPPKSSISKSDVAAILEEVGNILEILDENPFKVRAYANAARIIESLDGDLTEMVSSGELIKVKGIGKATFEIIESLVTTGASPQHDELKGRIPIGLLDMLRIPGLGPKKIKTIYQELELKNVGELEYACRENRLVDLEGFGAKSQEKILTGIENLKKYMERFLYSFAMEYAAPLYEAIATHPDTRMHLLAGSLRRHKETVKDIDIVVSATKSESIMDAFTSSPQVESIIAKGKTKSSVVLQSGINVDLRVVKEKEFPFACHYLTGSKDHNTQMRGRAKKMGIKMNEYGLFKGETSIPCKDEKTIFEKLGLDYIPPEIREGLGEIEAAENHTLPELIEDTDIRGIFHVHSKYSDGSATIAELVEACRALSFEYLGIADHSQSASYAGGLIPAEVKKQNREIKELNKSIKGFTLFHGIESDILSDGSLDYDAEALEMLDFVIASVHSNFGMSEADMTKRIIKAMEHPATRMLGHPTGRLLLAREGYMVNLHAVIEAAAELDVIIELNASPHRLDLDWRYLKAARERNVKIAINPDAHHTDTLNHYIYGIGIARKGWLTKDDVINTLSAAEIAKLFERKR